MPEEKKIQRILWFLILVSVAIRAIISGFIELGNDEVYYWTYANFPALSHFDHPPMVGLVIQFFTLNLWLDSEFFIRLGSVAFGALNTWLIYRIGWLIKDQLTGLFAAFLFTASFYCFIISGTFIMPDTPQVLFWLLSLYLLLQALPDKSLSKRSRKLLLFAGLTIGLALLSKYHSAFLIAGAFLYILFFNQKWFRAKETYIALVLAILMFLPVIFWNWQNDFISFTFHEGRLDTGNQGIRWEYFGTETLGQFLYNNPVNFILIVLAFIFMISGKKFMEKEFLRLVLLISLPLELSFLSFSLFSRTLPHWTGPAYLGFILITASWLKSVFEKKHKIVYFPWPLRISVLLMIVFVTLAFGQIRYGWIPIQRWGIEDVTFQLYGNRQLGEKFTPIAQNDKMTGVMDSCSPILTFRWFPAANFDYYVASPINKDVYALGSLQRIHKYYWIDKTRGALKRGTNAYYIALSDDFEDPSALYGNLFDSIQPPDTIQIFRGKELVRQAYVYRLIGLRSEVKFDNFTK